MLPTELELAEAYAVSRHTVREALRQLEAQGLVSRRQGAGTVVVATEAPERFVQAISSVQELLQYPDAEEETEALLELHAVSDCAGVSECAAVAEAGTLLEPGAVLLPALVSDAAEVAV